VSGGTVATRLAKRLASKDVSVRRNAAAEALGRSRAGKPLGDARQALISAVSDPDDQVSVNAALSILHAAWRTGRLGEVVAALEHQAAEPSEDARTRARVAARALARVTVHPEKASGLLQPVLLDAIEDPSPQIRSAALAGFAELILRGVDVSRHVSRLAKLLDEPNPSVPWHAVSLFSCAARSGLDVAPALPAAQRMLDTADDLSRLTAADMLAWNAIRSGDATGLVALVHHPSVAVREGTTQAVADAAERGLDVSLAVPALAHALKDGSGAVVKRVVRALDAAVRRRVDLSAAVPLLLDRCTSLSYLAGERTFDMDAIGVADLREESPARDVGEVLSHHFLNTGEGMRIAMLLEHAEPAVRSGARDVLESAHLAHPEAVDVARRLLARHGRH